MGYINPVGFIFTREDIDMNREKVIEWLRENTTREQWNNRGTLFFLGVSEDFAYDWETVPYDNAEGVCVRGCRKNKDAKPIHYSDVWEQPAFINGAKYFIHPLTDLGYPFNGVPFTYDININRFTDSKGAWFSADSFGTKFTVELVSMGPTPPESRVSPMVRVCELRDYLKLDDQQRIDDICEAALSRLKEQAIIVGRVGKLNEVCQKYNIGSIGDSVVDSVIDYIKLHNGAGTAPYVTDRATPRNKYDREILPGVYVDVYDVLAAFTTNSAAIDHAVKKLLAPGQRGVKDRVTDLKEAVSSIQREIDRIGEWSDRAAGGQISKSMSYVIGEAGLTTIKFKPSHEDTNQ